MYIMHPDHSNLLDMLLAYGVCSYSLRYLWSFWPCCPALGGVVSPIVCQTIISAGVPWFRFYYGSLVLSAVVVGFVFCTFKPTRREFSVERAAFVEESRSATSQALPLDEYTSHLSEQTHVTSKTPANSKNLDLFQRRRLNLSMPALRLALSLPYQWAFSVFSMIYCGRFVPTLPSVSSWLFIKSQWDQYTRIC